MKAGGAGGAQGERLAFLEEDEWEGGRQHLAVFWVRMAWEGWVHSPSPAGTTPPPPAAAAFTAASAHTEAKLGPHLAGHMCRTHNIHLQRTGSSNADHYSDGASAPAGEGGGQRPLWRQWRQVCGINPARRA